MCTFLAIIGAWTLLAFGLVGAWATLRAYQKRRKIMPNNDTPISTGMLPAAMLTGYLWLLSGLFVVGYITTWRHETCPNWSASAAFIAERIVLGPILIPAPGDCSMSDLGHIINIASVAIFGVAVTIVARLISRRR